MGAAHPIVIVHLFPHFDPGIPDPEFIILDEPTSALDVSVQAHVLQTLSEIQKESKLAFLLISHDIAVVRYMCSRLNVMYLGKIVEEGPRDVVFSSPGHPYTKALLDAVPRLRGKREPKKTRVVLKGEVTTTNVRLSACPLLPRCPYKMDKCNRMPPAVEVSAGHRVACWLVS